MSNIKKKDTTKALSQKQNIFSHFEGILTYFKEVRSEWGKITWPERGQVLRETLVVIVIVFFFTVLVYFLDKIFHYVLLFLEKIF